MANKFAVIVDAYSTGAKLASKFQAEGISVLHVQSAAPIIDFYVNDFRPDDFIANVIFTGLAECVADIDQALNGAKPMCVLAGAETGIELADLLAAELGLPGNATNSSRVRRDKYAPLPGRRPCRHIPATHRAATGRCPRSSKRSHRASPGRGWV